jgi:branched-chain amino acid transport system substrate-binding protein
MRNKKTTFILVTLVFLLFLAFSSQSQAGQTYKLGISLALTGPTSDVGVPYSKAIEDYLRYVNEEKLLGDDKVEVFIKDDGYKTEVTKRNFESYLDEGIVLFLAYSTGSTLALKKDFEEEKIPVIPASFHAGNIVDSNYVFLPIVSYSSQTIAFWLPIIKGVPPKSPCSFIHPPSAVDPWKILKKRWPPV